MDISVEDINSVDKKIIITADREDLEPKFEEAYKRYQKQINLPGFRPGKVPLKLIRKRFGDEIEQEEVSNYIQDVFENQVVEEYEPVGEAKMLDHEWDGEELEAEFQIGQRPEFELVDLEQIEVDRMVHDVDDEEVEEELERMLENEGEWKEIDDEATEDCRVIVDATALDKDGNPIEEDKEEDQTIDLRQEDNEVFREKLVGSKAGDVVTVTFGDEDEDSESDEELSNEFQIEVKRVEKPEKVELTDQFAKEQSNGQAENVDEFRSFLKSQMQDYYDRRSDEMFRNEIIEEITEAHDFEVPEVFIDQVKNNYVQQVRQQYGDNLPEDFDEEVYKERMEDQAHREGKWYFINDQLQEEFDDIDIDSDDIDEYLASEAERHGVTTDQMRNVYAQNPQQLESLRNQIREQKVFDRLEDKITVNEVTRDEYQEKQEEKNQKEATNS